jgi:hypothetical protein
VRVRPGLAAGYCCISSQMRIMTVHAICGRLPCTTPCWCPWSSDRPISHSHSLHVNMAPLSLLRCCGRQRRRPLRARDRVRQNQRFSSCRNTPSREKFTRTSTCTLVEGVTLERSVQFLSPSQILQHSRSTAVHAFPG